MVTFSRTCSLVLLFISWACIADEGTVLIDTEQGIDNTQDPTITELNELSDLFDSDDDPVPETDVSTEEKTESITGSEPEPPSESNVLIDKAKGIDTTRGEKIDELNELSRSLSNIDEEKETTEATEASTPPETETITSTPVADKPKPSPSASSTAEEKTKDKTVLNLPSIAPKTIESKEQKAESKKSWKPNDNDLRILEIRVGQYKLVDVVTAYQYEDIVLVPIGALSEILDLAISVDTNLAQGFTFKEEWTFLLDTTRTEVVLKGAPESYDESLVHVLEDDIYVESNLLSRWMLMNLDIDLFSSRMWITSEEKFPFIKRIEREQRIAKSLARLNLTKESFPVHYEPYKNWSVPFLDQSVRAGILKDENGDTSTSYQYTTHVSADLLKHESTWFMTGDDEDPVDEFRVTMGRHDSDAELLGFMKASQYAFGNVAEPRLKLITSSSSLEPGLAVSNYPLGRQVEYDRHRFRGELLPDWEVEIYQNNALIGYQQTPIDGQYDFPDIPLLFGNNHFRLVFYGPQGQIRQVEERYNLSQSLTKKGKHYYLATTTTDEIDGTRTTAQYDYGISENISSSFALVSIPLQDGADREQHNYTKAGLRGFWDSYLASFDFIVDSASGSAIELDLQTQIDSTVVGFKNIEFSDFFSEEFIPDALQLSRRSIASINTAIPPSSLPRIPVDFGFRRDEYENGDSLFEITNRLSTNARGYALSNLLTRQQSTGQDALFNGTFQVSTNINRLRLRGSVNYAFEPDSELTSLAATLDPGQYKDYHLTFGLSHSLEQDLTEYTASANKATGKYNLSFGARYNSDNEINLDVSLSVGFGYEPRRHQWDSNASTVANQGSVSARVFLDSDQDGIYGENDEPLDNIGFTLNNGYSAARTADDGIVFLTSLSPYEPLNIAIAPETMSDPLWTAALEGIQVTPRPGHAILLDFPIFMSGEIDGTVYLSRNNQEFGVGKVIVELVDQFDRVVKTTETAYDGFYVMSNIPLGTYQLRVSDRQLDKLSLKLNAIESVEMSSDNLFINGVDFVLSPKKE